MIRPTILIDKDGVLADFVPAALAVHGLTMPDPWPEKPNDPLHRKLDIEAAFGMSHDDFWKPIHAIGEEFWLGLAPIPEGLALYEQLSKKYQVIICTTPARDASSSSGKVLWLQQQFGTRFRDYSLTPKKWRLANPKMVLIDDSDDNVIEFRRHRGLAWLFPRPWNSGGGIINHADLDTTLQTLSPQREIPEGLQDALVKLEAEYGTETLRRALRRHTIGDACWQCVTCGRVAADSVMLRDEIWQQVCASLDVKRFHSIICIDCIQRGLDRRLQPHDLHPCPLSAPIRWGMEIGAAATPEERASILQDTDWHTRFWARTKPDSTEE